MSFVLLDALRLGILSLALSLCGCEKAAEKPAPKEDRTPVAATPAAPAKPPTPNKEEPGHEGHDHGKADDHAHDDHVGNGGHSGEVIALGASKLGAFEVRAARDKGDIKPGGDAPVDVWIDGAVGKGVTAVRFWIGSEDAKGSIKAKAEIEDGKWHTHVEVPSPMPEPSRLWVEIEEAQGKKSLASFDLRRGG